MSRRVGENLQERFSALFCGEGSFMSCAIESKLLVTNRDNSKPLIFIILCFVFRTKIKNYSVECGNKNVKFIKVKENKRVTYRGN